MNKADKFLNEVNQIDQNEDLKSFIKNLRDAKKAMSKAKKDLPSNFKAQFTTAMNAIEGMAAAKSLN